MAHIIVVGSINMDLVVQVTHRPLPGETIIGSDAQIIPGGKGANQAVAAARLGADVTLIGCVGEDAFGSQLLANLEAEKVDIRHVSTVKDISSGIALITVDETGQNSIIVAPGANYKLTPERVAAAWEHLPTPDAVVAQLEVPLDSIVKTAQLAKSSGAPFILNPAPGGALPETLFQDVDVLVPNETEAALLTGKPIETFEQKQAAADTLKKMGVGAVVLTIGHNGALLWDGERMQHVAAHRVQVVDTTAAGDAFVGALSVYLAENNPLSAAVRMANGAGALAVTRWGAQPAMPTRRELDRFLEERLKTD